MSSKPVPGHPGLCREPGLKKEKEREKKQKDKKKFYCVWMFCLHVHLSTHHIHAAVMEKKKGDLPPRTGVTNGCEPPCGA